MSRSYKKNAWWKDYNKDSKKIAARITRRKLKDLDAGYIKGNRYRKQFNSYNISDYKFPCSWEDFENWSWTNCFETKEKAYAYWKAKYGSK